MIATAQRIAGHVGLVLSEQTRLHSQGVVPSAILYLAISVLFRLPMLGKPAFQADEQFYLLVGERMAGGALPFVDLWDRKPFGLFLLFRGVFLTPFDPVLTYQVMGLAFSVLTALVIEHMARDISPLGGSRMAGAAYLLYQCVFNVALGQAPVFYNLPVALAALMTLRAMHKRESLTLMREGAAIMLLLGLALQIKYTVLFEGIGFGVLLLLRAHRDDASVGRLLGLASVWATIALTPTASVFAGYTIAGHGATFIQANFLSIFGRATDHADAFAQLGKECLAMLPFALAILVAPSRLSSGETPSSLPYLRAWACFAVAGFLVLPPWYDHYLGPVLVPLSVLAAPALGRIAPGERWYGRLLLGFGTLGAILVPAFQVRERGTADEFARAAALIRRELNGRCLYVYEGDSALYLASRACIPTRFAFPSHLNAMNEAGALGIDPVTEVRRIIGSRPGVVVIAESERPNQPNRATRTIVATSLARHYERYAGVALGTRRFGFYRLKR